MAAMDLFIAHFPKGGCFCNCYDGKLLILSPPPHPTPNVKVFLFISIYLFGVLHRFQHCIGHITTHSFVGRRNQYIQFVQVLNCKLPTICKQLPSFPDKVWGLNCRPHRWEASVLPLHQHGPECESIVFTSVFCPHRS